VDNQESSGGWPALFDFEFQPGHDRHPEVRVVLGDVAGHGGGPAREDLYEDEDHEVPHRGAQGPQPAHRLGGERRRASGCSRAKYQWWEEYPTRNRPTYVLTGFIYCLIGTYDVAKLLNDSRAQQLYDERLRSLTRMVNLYDLGSHTSYDLAALQRSRHTRRTSPGGTTTTCTSSCCPR
jgi:hypothetical protein